MSFSLLFMVLHGDCPAVASGTPPPKMQMIKLHPDGKTADFLCHACQGKVRFSQQVLVEPVVKVVESPRAVGTSVSDG